MTSMGSSIIEINLTIVKVTIMGCSYLTGSSTENGSPSRHTNGETGIM